MNKGNRVIAFIKHSAILTAVLIALTSTSVLAQSRKASSRAQMPSSQSMLKSEAVFATTELIKATTEYKSSLATLLSMYEAELKNTQQQLETRKQLFPQGIISKK